MSPGAGLQNSFETTAARDGFRMIPRGSAQADAGSEELCRW